MYKILIIFCLTISKMLAFAQCDNTLHPTDNVKVAYKSRGNRCEGEYSAKIAAPSLEITGLTIGILAYKLEKKELIEITNTTKSGINIRSSAIPLGSYYRMDAFLKNGQTFKWEVKDVLYELGIPSQSLAVYGWIGPNDDKTYVPVKPISSIYEKTNTSLYLVIRPSTKVLSVKYRYATVEQNLKIYQDINRSFSRGQPIVIILPPNLQGAYIVEIKALLESKSDWVVGQYKIFIP